jgi:calcineurin-like phosphoesterase family protein
MEPISRRTALAVLLAPLAAAGCSFDSILSPSDRQDRSQFGLSRTDPHLTLIGAGDTHSKANIGSSQRTGRMMQALLSATPAALAFHVGDLTEHGTAAELELYHSVWGSFKERTHFMMGNCDLATDPKGAAYYKYVGELGGPSGKGYYAKTYGAWRCYFMNSQANRSEQTTWLANDLPHWAGYHIMAMWHQPMFASICAHNKRAMTYPGALGVWWKLLQDYGAEFVVSGHVHRYERFARMLRDGTASNLGIRQFISGTGGVGTMNILKVHPLSERQFVARGAMRFDLYADRYEWKFTDLTGVVRDSGVQICHRVPARLVA